MGRNLVLNMGDHDFAVVGYDKDPEMVRQLNANIGERKVLGVNTLTEFIEALRVPRNIMLMVPAGSPVDAVIRDLKPYLDPLDLIIDGGNSHYKDTELRHAMLAKKNIHYLGVGISGGESGARHGPSLMPGGALEDYQRVREIFEMIAAQVEGEPCVTYLGPDAAGHFVKMVHNGIEYGLMQLIAETYDLMKRGLNLDDDQLHKIFAWWNQMELSGFLVEITANIFSEVDPESGNRLVDVILDEANQKGTGKWTSEAALDLQVPTPTIDVAVATRNISMLKEQRLAASQLLTRRSEHFKGDHEKFLDALRTALYAAVILTFAQGFALLEAASESYGYALDLAAIARIWRGGCIIRTSLLHNIRTAYQKQPDLANLLLDPQLSEDVMRLRKSLVKVVRTAAKLGTPAPAMMASLAYLDSYRSAWLPANLIQAQRDYFGAHTYERIDEKGVFHTRWEPDFGENDDQR
jgi:6-phosphogluconate dehydrogenase